MMKSISVSKNVQTWHMIGWRHNHQSMKSHARKSLQKNKLDLVSISRPSFPGMGIRMLKMRRSWNCLIFNMGTPILVGRHLHIDTAPLDVSTNPGQWSIISSCCEPCHTHVVISGSSLWTLMGFSCSWHCYAVINIIQWTAIMIQSIFSTILTIWCLLWV